MGAKEFFITLCRRRTNCVDGLRFDFSGKEYLVRECVTSRDENGVIRDGFTGSYFDEMANFVCIFVDSNDVLTLVGEFFEDSKFWDKDWFNDRPQIQNL